MKQPWTRHLPAFIRRKLEASSQLNAVISNTGWMMGDKALRMGVGLVVGIWVARYLGPELYGQYSYALAFAMMFSSLAMLGLDVIVIRKIVKDPTCRDEVLGTAFLMMLLGGLAALVLAVTTSFLVRPGDILTHWLVGIMTGGTIFQAFIAIEFWFESQLQWKFTVYSKNTAYLLISVIKIVLIVTKAPLIAFAWAGFAEIAIGSAGLVIAYHAKGYRLKAWHYSRSMAATLLKDCWPLVFSVFLTMVYSKIDQVMLGTMAGDKEVGLYSAAVRLTEVWSFIPIAICSSVFPAILISEKNDAELFNRQMQKLYNLMAFIAYCIAIPVMLLSNGIIDILFQAAYTKTGPLLSALIWTLVFTNLSTARFFFLVSKNWLRINLISTLMGCILNVSLNYFLIPAYGAMGAIIASLISYWFAVHGTCFLIRPLRPTGWMLAKAMLYPKFW